LLLCSTITSNYRKNIDKFLKKFVPSDKLTLIFWHYETQDLSTNTRYYSRIIRTRWCTILFEIRSTRDKHELSRKNKLVHGTHRFVILLKSISVFFSLLFLRWFSFLLSISFILTVFFLSYCYYRLFFVLFENVDRTHFFSVGEC